MTLQLRQQLTRDIPDTPGIYLIECLATGRKYIGAAIDMRRRVKDHLSLAEIGHNSLKDDFNNHGLATFRVEALEEVTAKNQLFNRELFWHSVFEGADLYNTEPPKQNRFWI